jgi:hypothetical protein
MHELCVKKKSLVLKILFFLYVFGFVKLEKIYCVKSSVEHLMPLQH